MNRSTGTECGSGWAQFCGRNRTRTYDLCDVNAALLPAELSAHGKDYTTTTGNEQVDARHGVRQVVRHSVWRATTCWTAPMGGVLMLDG